MPFSFSFQDERLLSGHGPHAILLASRPTWQTHIAEYKERKNREKERKRLHESVINQIPMSSFSIVKTRCPPSLGHMEVNERTEHGKARNLLPIDPS